jgi:hypothetical protein
MKYGSAAAIAISIAGKLPQQKYVVLASCRNSNIYCWQAAATAICFAGKLPQKLFSHQVVKITVPYCICVN